MKLLIEGHLPTIGEVSVILLLNFILKFIPWGHVMMQVWGCHVNYDMVFFVRTTPSGPYDKKQLTFLVHCVSDVYSLYLQ
jgi:hypothetical protein